MNSRKKKLATAGGSVAIVAAAIAMTAGTYSYFSDDATAAPNSIKAGTLNVTVGGSAQDVPFNAVNVAPGTGAGSKMLDITNAGSLPGTLTLRLVKDSDTENDCGSESERVVDPTCGSDNSGELGSEMIITAYDPTWTNQIRSNTVNSWASAPALNLGQLGSGETKKMPIGTWINAAVNNKIQSDSTSFHFEVRLDQVH